MKNRKEQYINLLLEEKLNIRSSELLSELSKDEMREIIIAHRLKAIGDQRYPDKKFIKKLHLELQEKHTALYADQKRTFIFSWARIIFPAALMVLLLTIVSVGFWQLGEYRLAQKKALKDDAFVPQTRLVQDDAISNDDVLIVEKDLYEIDNLLIGQENQLAFLDADIGTYENSLNGIFDDLESDLELILQ